MENEVMKICATCLYARVLGTLNQIICKNYGIVSPNDCCKKYEYNIFREPPKKKRSISNFTEDDFKID